MMKMNIRKIVMLTAALSALTAFPLAANAADNAGAAAIAQSGSAIGEGSYWLDLNAVTWKNTYRIGEPLDLSGLLEARLYGAGDVLDEVGNLIGEWDAFGENTLGERIEAGSMQLDTSKFDNTKPGTYTITFYDADGIGSVEVKVINEVYETTTDDVTGHCCEDRTTAYYDCELYFDTHRNGDINGNGKLEIADAILLARYIAEDDDISLSPESKLMADANSDNHVNAKDLMLLLKGLTSSERMFLICIYDSEGNRIEAEDITTVVSTTTTTTVTTISWDSTEEYGGTNNCCTDMTNEGSYGSLEIYNLDMTDEESMDQFRVPAPKTIYRVGEALDLSNLVFIGNGVISTSDRYEYWDIFPPQILGQAPDYDKNIKVDSSEFDSTKPGTYTIYLHLYENNTDMKIASGSFQVTVIPDEPTEGTQLTEYDDGWETCTTDSWGGYWLENDTWKDTYCIGEELDIEGLLNAPLYGGGAFYEPDGMGGYIQVYWDAFGEETLGERIKSGRMTLDTSAFDNTKPGIYTITFYDETASGSVEVRVISDKAAAPLPRVKKDF